MGLAIDSVVFSLNDPGTAGGAATANTGDSLTIRNFPNSAYARIDAIARQGATEGFIELKSPRMHDAVRGLHVISVETPTVFLLPRQTGQPVYPADTMTVNISGGTNELDAGAFFTYYSDLPGVSAHCFTWDSLLSQVVNLKPLEVDVGSQATGAGWSDTTLTTTENLLKADTWYALLGYEVDAACLAVGIKGPETGNLRFCGPGSTSSFPTHDYFIQMSVLHKQPYVVVFNANNRANLFCSTATVSTSATPKVVLNLAELARGFTP